MYGCCDDPQSLCDNKLVPFCCPIMPRKTKGTVCCSGSWSISTRLYCAIVSNTLVFADAKRTSATQDQWIQRNVPIAVLPLAAPKGVADGALALCGVMFLEEKMAFEEALRDSTSA